MSNICKSKKAVLRNNVDVVGSESSVELAQTTKGIPTRKVKVYNSNPDLVHTKADEIYIQEKYGTEVTR